MRLKNKIRKYLFNRMIDTEAGRMKVLGYMNENVLDYYDKQSLHGNVYNFFIEFMFANKFIVSLIEKGDEVSLEILKRGLFKTFTTGVDHIRNELYPEKKINQTIEEKIISSTLPLDPRVNSEGLKKRPPIGLMPRWVHMQKRRLDIIQAMNRYTSANKEIPIEWQEELDRINEEI